MYGCIKKVTEFLVIQYPISWIINYKNGKLCFITFKLHNLVISILPYLFSVILLLAVYTHIYILLFLYVISSDFYKNPKSTVLNSDCTFKMKGKSKQICSYVHYTLTFSFLCILYQISPIFTFQFRRPDFDCVAGVIIWVILM